MVKPVLFEDNREIQEKLFGAVLNQGGGDAESVIASTFPSTLKGLSSLDNLDVYGYPRRKDRPVIFDLRQLEEWSGISAYGFIRQTLLSWQIVPNHREFLQNLLKSMVRMLYHPTTEDVEMEKVGRFARLKRILKE